MPQPKGRTGNPNGRPKGTPNKVTATVRNWLADMIQKNQTQLEQDFLSLQPLERLAMLEKLLPYIMPKVQNATEVENACYTKDDFKDSDMYDLDFDKKVKNWYE